MGDTRRRSEDGNRMRSGHEFPAPLPRDGYKLPAPLFCRPWLPFGSTVTGCSPSVSKPLSPFPYCFRQRGANHSGLKHHRLGMSFGPDRTTAKSPCCKRSGTPSQCAFSVKTLTNTWSKWKKWVTSNCIRYGRTWVTASRGVSAQTSQNVAKNHVCEDRGAMEREGHFMLSPKGSYFGKSSHESGGKYTLYTR